MKPRLPQGKILVQFDSYCILCSWVVQRMIRADKHRKFVFKNLPDDEKQDTVIVTDNGKTFRYFDAVLKIGKELGGIYRLVFIFRVLPQTWRHRLYLWIARKRFDWFGRRKTCYLPPASDRERFI